jgi:ferredoxin-type protein NapF
VTATGSLSRRGLLRGGGTGGARVRIADACLTRRGIVCRTCGDLCPVGAIRFRPILGGVPQPAIDAGTCTLCGECGPPCPVTAIEITDAA